MTSRGRFQNAVTSSVWWWHVPHVVLCVNRPRNIWRHKHLHKYFKHIWYDDETGWDTVDYLWCLRTGQFLQNILQIPSTMMLAYVQTQHWNQVEKQNRFILSLCENLLNIRNLEKIIWDIYISFCESNSLLHACNPLLPVQESACLDPMVSHPPPPRDHPDEDVGQGVLGVLA